MKKILDCVDELKKILVDSDVYQNYLLAKKNLSDEELALIKEYKRLHIDFINKKSNSFEDEKIISSLYSRLNLNPRTHDFLKSELILTDCLKEIYIKIGEDLDINVFA